MKRGLRPEREDPEGDQWVLTGPGAAGRLQGQGLGLGGWGVSGRGTGKGACRTAAREGGSATPPASQGRLGEQTAEAEVTGHVGVQPSSRGHLPLCKHRAPGRSKKHFPLSQNLPALSDPETWSASAPQAEVNWFRLASRVDRHENAA